MHNDNINRVDVVGLAGRANTGRLQAVSDEEQEALIRVAGRPQVEYVLDSLRGATFTGKLLLVGPQDLDAFTGPAIERLPAAGDILENLKRGLTEATSEWVMVATSDIPLLEPDMVDEFIRDCMDQPGADVYMPVVPAEVLEAFHADMKRTYGKVREGRFTGGNLFLIKRDVPPHAWQRAEEFVAARKNVLQLASLLGIGFILRMLFWPPSIAQLEKRISSLAGLPVKAVHSTCAQLAVDCDKPEDYTLIFDILQAQSRAGEGERRPE